MILCYTDVAMPITERVIEERSQACKINICHAFISLFEKVVLGNGNVISLVQMQDTVLLYRVSPLLLEIPGYLVRGT